MPRLFRPFSFIACCLLLSAAALLALQPTDEPINQLIEKIRAYNQQYPHEKAYLHTDRDTYLPGETIWMKSYLFYGETGGADSSSGAVFVDLVSPNGRRILFDTRLRSVGGFGSGYLTLPDTLSTGRYTLRAYTGWMRNFAEQWYFNKSIDVVKPDAAPAQRSSAYDADQLRPDVQFLPEGGQLVAGLPGRVAVKALSPAGVGVDVEGYVLTDKDTVAGFTSQHLGMGQFQFTPEAGRTYTAYARVAGTTTPHTSYTMPAPVTAGYAMQIDGLGNKDNIRVFISHTMPTAAPSTPESGTLGGKLTVLAQANGQPIHAAQALAGRRAFMVPIPRAKCPEGIIQITLFDEAMKPVAERLVYAAQNEPINLSVKPRRTTVGTRQRVDLDLTATNAEGKPVAANLSMAVTDEAQQPKNRRYSQSVLTYKLLTSDLTGHIEQPGYYFDAANKDRFVKLDLLLMTQGWRRFTWDKVLASTLPETRYSVDPGLTLSGTIFRGTSRVPAPGVNLTIMLNRKDSTQDIFAATSDEKGRFFVADANLIDTTSVLVQASQGKNRNFNVVLDKLFSPTVRVARPPLVPTDLAYEELAELLKRQGEYQAIEAQIRRNREIQLQAVVVKAKRNDPYASQRGIFSNADVSVKVDDIISAGAVTIFDMLRGRVAGVQVTGSGFEPVVQIRGAANFSGAIEPQFLLDGMPVDKSTIATINPRDVAYIDVIKGAGAALLGSRGAGGGINIIMKRGGTTGDYNNVPAPGVRIEKVVGFMPKREFYAPRYDNPTPEEKVRPDYRATLYWAPTLVTDANGRATVSFYASDAKTTLRIRTEGSTVAGQVGHAETTVKVE